MNSKKMLSNIQSVLRSGGTLEVSNYLHATRYTKPEHAELSRLEMKTRTLESRAKLAQIRCYLASDKYTQYRTEINKRLFFRTHNKEIRTINALRLAGRL